MVKDRSVGKMEDLFPYVKHSLRTICKPVLDSFQFYSQRMFSPIKIDGLDKVKEVKASYPDSCLVYISRHRSHLDYIETQLALANAKIPARIQAGDNLFIGPLDPFWRELGAFMVVREGHGFYSKNWILNTVYSMMPKRLGPYKKEYETYIDKKLAKTLYESYLENILSKDEFIKDLLVYPEYTKQSDGSTKYGRSYSGSLLNFSPYLFIVLRRIVSHLDKKFFFVPVNPSYERVIEDSFMVKIPELKERRSRNFVYLEEFAYIFTRPLFPFFTRGKFTLKFGEPLEISKSDNVKAGAVEDVRNLKDYVGLLETPFSPQIVFCSMGDERKVHLRSLEDSVMSNISRLPSSVDVSYLKANGQVKSLDSMLDDTLRLFDAPGRRYVRIKDRSLEILNKSVVAQYANHIAHLF